MAAEAQEKEVPRRSESGDIKGRLVEFAWMKQEGYATETIRSSSGSLRALIARGVALTDPMTVKDALAREQKWSGNRRRNVINA